MRKQFSLKRLYWVKFYISLSLWFCCVGLAPNSIKVAHASTTGKPPAKQPQQQTDQLKQVVLARLAFYAKHYPDIDFVVLDSAGDVSKNMQILARILGEDPEPLDYVHPADLRHSLLMSMLVRIQLLLQSEIGSATLFAPGKDALARRKQVCVVTLSPSTIAIDDRAATRHLLEIPKQEFDEIPPTHYLDHLSHLRFALDHEVYHCLDTSYNGPIPMSQKRYWGEYHMYRNEEGADAFATLMQMAMQGKVTADDRTLRLIQGLALLNDDPNHNTYSAITAALHVDPKLLREGKVKTCFRLATQIRDRVVGSYSDYLRYAAAAEQAMHRLGVSQVTEHFDDVRLDRKLVKKLVTQTRHAYQGLTGHVLPGADK